MYEKQLIIFTDLDGTLLDKKSYSFAPARHALIFLKKEDIPLIFCTSKTRAEIELYRRKIGNSDPFISENGGAIFIPNGYFEFPFFFHREMEGYQVIEFGTPYPVLVETLKLIGGKRGISLRLFSDMTAEEVATLCQLPLEEALLAKKRWYDEPFLVHGDRRDVEEVKKQIKASGFNYTRGGRFHHIIGDNDKGNAVKALTELYEKKYGKVCTVGLGDSLNDLPMLNAVDIPILVQKEDGSYDPEVKPANLVKARGIGPHGWNEAIKKIIKSP